MLASNAFLASIGHRNCTDFVRLNKFMIDNYS